MTTVSQIDSSQELSERGWRTEIVPQPDGSIIYIKIPLTAEEFLHPQEGYHLPNSAFHDDVAGDAKDMLARRYDNDSTTAVFDVLGYRLVEGHYLPLSPDENGRILCETVGLWIGLEDARVVMVDAESGDRLLSSRELEQRASQAEQRASQAEQRAARLADLLRSQGLDPDQV
jgi:hypothetical protein